MLDQSSENMASSTPFGFRGPSSQIDRTVIGQPEHDARLIAFVRDAFAAHATAPVAAIVGPGRVQ